jgi:hypothetical protein
VARTHWCQPNYSLGHGLSYTTFSYGDLKVEGGETIEASFTVTNTGQRDGADVPQIYLTEAAGDQRMRLLGFERVELKPGEARRVTVTADPRLLARFDREQQQWRIDEGNYVVALSRAADAPVEKAGSPSAGALVRILILLTMLSSRERQATAAAGGGSEPVVDLTQHRTHKIADAATTGRQTLLAHPHAVSRHSASTLRRATVNSAPDCVTCLP